MNPGNADEIVKQWLDLHHLPLQPMSEGVVSGHPHRIWWNAQGETVVDAGKVALSLSSGQTVMLPKVPDQLLINSTPSPKDCE